MQHPGLRHYRSRASNRAVRDLLRRMTTAEKTALAAALIARNTTIHHYVGSLLTACERWDLVEWEAVPEGAPPESPFRTASQAGRPGRSSTGGTV
jgi:hypothetical protein